MSRLNFANPLNLADSYKVGHRPMYPKGMTHLQSNFTPRASRIPSVKKVVFVALQAFLQRILMDYFNEEFFGRPVDEVVGRHKQRVEGLLGQPFDDQHWRDLHALGYLPLRFSALPEGTEVPLGVPMFIIENTVPGYGWLVNYFESVLSNEDWLPMTSATTALRYRRMLDAYAKETSDTPEFVDWQGHDFSFRGMGSFEAGAASGAGHLLSFAGSDTLAAMDWIDRYYGDDPEAALARVRFSGGSVPASEHSVMCVDGKGKELETIQRLLVTFPKGIVSIVSDTWDLWYVITKILPKLRDPIMGREGKLVIRPDSGDPVKILCGDPEAAPGSPPHKGVVELLGDIFGVTTNSKGFRVLDSRIGTIYGDAINYERAEEICRLLRAKRYASTNPVLGIGSYTYQYVTRDTYGFAMKATWARVDDVGHDLFKDPVTDIGSIKRSARGRLAVLQGEDGELKLINGATPEDEAKSQLRPVWEDGRFLRRTTYREIVQRLGVRKLLPE
jgi:nicotinamide phosphoribosyltransferase